MPQPLPVDSGEVPPMIAIGASTGGPKAIATILTEFPADLPACVVVVQHIDRVFADGLADWLQKQTPLRVRTAVEGSRPALGVVDVAATNDHLILRQDGRFAYTHEPPELPYRPSVNVFFRSIANRPPGAVTGVLLTGIGADGARGMFKLRESGHYTIAQDAATCVVFGMPKAAIELKAAAEILPIEQIARRLLKRLGRSSDAVERTSIELPDTRRQ
jgi:two-component system response regulator WspF